MDNKDNMYNLLFYVNSMHATYCIYIFVKDKRINSRRRSRIRRRRTRFGIRSQRFFNWTSIDAKAFRIALRREMNPL